MPRKSPLVRKARSEAKSSVNRRRQEDSDEAPSRSSRRKKSSSGSPAWMKRGREEVDKQKEKSKGDFKPFVPEFWLSDGERALIKIPEPMDDLERTVSQHVIPNHGKGRKFLNFTCTQDPSCPFCKKDSRASVRWPLLVIDLREMEYKDPNGKKVKKKGVVKMWLPSINELDSVQMEIDDARDDEEDEDIDVDNSLWRVTRKGSGSNTKYFWKRVKETSISSAEKKKIAEFEETHGTLVEILAPPDDKTAKKYAGTIQEDDDDEEDDDYEDDDDDDYEDID